MWHNKERPPFHSVVAYSGAKTSSSSTTYQSQYVTKSSTSSAPRAYNNPPPSSSQSASSNMKPAQEVSKSHAKRLRNRSLETILDTTSQAKSESSNSLSANNPYSSSGYSSGRGPHQHQQTSRSSRSNYDYSRSLERPSKSAGSSRKSNDRFIPRWKKK